MNDLLAKIKERGVPLGKFAGVKPLSGIKTGYNQAFLVDEPTKNELVVADASSADLLRPYLRGQDFGRWSSDSVGYWMIVLCSSENFAWPWRHAGEDAERIFRHTFPAIHAHLAQHRGALTKRQDQGRYWWELRSCAYWADFDNPKIMYPEITWRAAWSLDTKHTLCNNTAYILPSDELWILAVANAPVTWWYAWRSATHGKDEALRFIKEFVQYLPIPTPSDAERDHARRAVTRLRDIAELQHGTCRAILDWLRVEYEIEKPSKRLQSLLELGSDDLVAEVRKVRGKKRPLSVAALKGLREEHARTIEPARALAGEALALEHQISDLVNAAYGLTPAEVALLWQTAPPRMPVQPSTAHRLQKSHGLPPATRETFGTPRFGQAGDG